MARDVSTGVFIGGLAVLFLVVAVVLPSNGITGKVAETCAHGSCLELCDVDADCDGAVCCSTRWDTGVCGLPSECGKVMEYSLYQSVEVYQDTLREQGPAVDASWSRFFLPLLLALVAVWLLVRRK